MVKPSGRSLESPHTHDDIHALLKVLVEVVEVGIDFLHGDALIVLGDSSDVSLKDAIRVDSVVLSNIHWHVSVDVVLLTWAKV